MFRLSWFSGRAVCGEFHGTQSSRDRHCNSTGHNTCWIRLEAGVVCDTFVCVCVKVCVCVCTCVCVCACMNTSYSSNTRISNACVFLVSESSTWTQNFFTVRVIDLDSKSDTNLTLSQLDHFSVLIFREIYTSPY